MVTLPHLAQRNLRVSSQQVWQGLPRGSLCLVLCMALDVSSISWWGAKGGRREQGAHLLTWLLLMTWLRIKQTLGQPVAVVKIITPLYSWKQAHTGPGLEVLQTG